MSGVALDYRIEDRKVRAMLQRLERFDRQAMADEIGGHLVSSTTQRFRDGVDPEGDPWQPSERALAEGDKTLVDRGHLRDSITYEVFPGGDGVEVGSNMVYAAIHQFGGQAGRNHSVTLPARPFLGISDDDQEEIDAIIQDHLREALG